MINIEQESNILHVSYINNEGGISIEKINIPSNEMFEWVYADPRDKTISNNVTSWDNKPVKKQKTTYLSKWRLEEFITSLPVETKNKILSFNQPKKFFIDIEVWVGDEWPKPDLAKFPITAISFCVGDKIISLGTKKIENDKILKIHSRIENYLNRKVAFNYLYFESEYDMLYSFFNKAIQKMPLLTGWNFIGFDWPYLINRCKHLNIDYNVASPTQKFKKELPLHRMVVDYLEVYKKWDRVIDIKENNTLDYVSKAALGIQKVKYNGNLQELYENDFESYIFYNAIDTKLVEMIDVKLNTLTTFLKLGNIVHVEADKAFSAIWMTESVMTREFLKMNKVFPKKDKGENTKNEKYVGALVIEPQVGMYKWITTFDFASLYPTIMRQWNISPETYIKKIDGNEEVDVEKYIKSASGAIFKKEDDSIFRKILTNYFSQRKSAKKEMMEIEEEIEKLKALIA